MNKIFFIFFVLSISFFPSQSCRAINLLNDDKVLSVAEQASAALVSSAIIADQWVQDNDCEPGKHAKKVFWTKTMLNATRLINGVLVLYNQYAYNKNWRLHKYTATWIIIDAIKCVLHFLPERALESLSHLISEKFDNVLLSEHEKYFYEWLDNNDVVKKIRAIGLSGAEIGATLWSSIDYFDDYEDGQERKLYLAAVKGIVRSLQEFYDAKNITLKRMYFLLFFIQACCLGWDFFDSPVFLLDVEGASRCPICLDDVEFGRRVKTGCNHRFHKKCLKKYFDTPRQLQLEVERLTAEQLRSEAVRQELIPRLRNDNIYRILDTAAEGVEREGWVGFGIRQPNPSPCPICRRCLDKNDFHIVPRLYTEIGGLRPDII